MSEINPPAILLLEDGTYYRGVARGKKGTTVGEICFNTGMTGYQEVFTDPSYYGQILVATNAHIGNYGTAEVDNESNKVQIEGLICKNFSTNYSRKLGDSELQKYFEDKDIVCISDVDTRAIVRHIRQKGAMNAIISSEDTDIDSLKRKLSVVPSMESLELASKVSTKEPYYLGDEQSIMRVAVLDFGTKANILKCLSDRGCYLKIFPAKTSFAELQEWNPDGYFFSNGPGDPASMDYAVDTAKQVLALNKPTFGICLGHQVIALAMGVKTFKMHHGHRGINHPVKNLKTGRCEITSQNHGFSVDKSSVLELADVMEITHVNLNDDTVEGLKIKGTDTFSVQFHPEASPGPHDSRYLFDQFVELMKNN